ncbi:hypothetical protein I203_108616 [Kwoniella mangroviensis CBS 8507]|uniref:hypothetical protein n=1 Tax=Kwoniella mangroviensis CBS 8507 TaxID=1296122 RepID=UPI003069339B
MPAITDDLESKNRDYAATFDKVRNAGASAKDALRSIVISQQLLGTREILLVKHTGYGMLTFENKDAYALVEKSLG